MKPIERILCPVDFSEVSDDALRYADRLAQSMHAELVLLHAFDIPKSYDAAGQRQPLDERIVQQLEQVQIETPDPRVRRVLHAGPPGEVICWSAQELDCDLIVMGTHGRTGLAHMFLGSVAEYVLRHARCPVLTVRRRPVNEPKLPEPRVVPLPPPMWM
jgi:universal stress protein A